MTTFVVTNRGDVVDANLTDLSLREALIQAAQHGGADRITFAASAFAPGAAEADRTVHLTAGELAITQSGGPLTIDGDVNHDGQADVVISAGGHGRVFKISGTAAAAAEVQLHGLVITGGRVIGNTEHGGGIRAAQADLVLTQTTVTGNAVVKQFNFVVQQDNGGGGIDLLNSTLHGDNLTISGNSVTSNGIARGGGLAAKNSTIELAHSSIADNSARASFNYIDGIVNQAHGGGIWTSGGRLRLSDTGISNNAVDDVGGALYADHATVEARHATVTGNTAPTGYFGAGYVGGLQLHNCTSWIIDSLLNRNSGEVGGIGADGGRLQIQGTTIRDNSGRGDDPNYVFLNGGGVSTHDAALTVRQSSILDNFGNGIGASGGSVLVDRSHVANNNGGGIVVSSATVVGSTIDHNGFDPAYPDFYMGVHGGITAHDLLLINSTVSSNAAPGFGDRYHDAFAAGTGGGIDATNAEVRNSTVVGNVALGADASDFFDAQGSSGGGIAAHSLVLTNSIVAGNRATDTINAYHQSPPILHGVDPDIQVDTITSNGHNIVSQSGIAGLDPGDQVLAPGSVFTSLLRPLADNGGGLPTHALRPGAAAIDAGANADALDQDGHPLLTDERGFDRLQGNGVDIGAVEHAVQPPIAAPDFLHPASHEPVTADVLANDAAAPGTSLIGSALEAKPDFGRVTHDADGSFVYRSDYGFHGTDQFSYEAIASDGGVSTASVLVGVWLPAGYDEIVGDGTSQILEAHGHSAQINGAAGDERLVGSPFADNLLGGDGDDHLLGGHGNDVLVGGAGADVLRGDAGADLFVLDHPAAADQILDFDQAAGDRVHLDIPALTRANGSVIADRLTAFQNGDDLQLQMQTASGSWIELATLVNTPNLGLGQLLDNAIG